MGWSTLGLHVGHLSVGFECLLGGLGLGLYGYLAGSNYYLGLYGYLAGNNYYLGLGVLCSSGSYFPLGL